MKKYINQMSLPENGDLIAIMKTDKWIMKIRLFHSEAPRTVDNFIWLANIWYYNWVIFHRVIKDFMIQWGDPTGTGMWWVSIYGEVFNDEFFPSLSNIRWSISMANSWPNTNGSQFFINQVDNEYLDFDKIPFSSKHSVFWQVYEWLENLDNIAWVKVNSEDNKPNKDIKIISIEIKIYQNWVLKNYENINSKK